MKDVLIYLPIPVVLFIDQIFKAFSPVGVRNTGIILGYMSELSVFVKSVLMTSGYLLLLVVFIYSMMLLTQKVPFLRGAAALFLGGVSSNCLDRMLFHFVRDHWTFDGEVFFNFADVCIWIGLPILVFFIFFYRKDIWREDCVRRSFVLVSKSHQQIIKHILGIFVFTIIIFSLFQVAFLKFINVGDSALYTYAVLSFIFGSCTLMLTGLFIFIYTQRIVGPLQKLQRHLSDEKLSVSEFNMRKGDPLVELKEISKIIQTMEREL
jgi:lipoprotein signal peptidase